jgi:hypothetical protein
MAAALYKSNDGCRRLTVQPENRKVELIAMHIQYTQAHVKHQHTLHKPTGSLALRAVWNGGS